MSVDTPMTIAMDNQAAIKTLDGEEASSKMKHVDVRLKFVCQHSRNGTVKPKYVESNLMMGDLMTKALPAPRLLELRELIGLY